MFANGNSCPSPLAWSKIRQTELTVRLAAPATTVAHGGKCAALCRSLTKHNHLPLNTPREYTRLAGPGPLLVLFQTTAQMPNAAHSTMLVLRGTSLR